MSVSHLAGKPAPYSSLTHIPRLIAAYYTEQPDPGEKSHAVSFGTSGHRGSSLKRSFNEHHIMAICQAVAQIRHEMGVSGPLFIGMDTHALSEPAIRTAIEVLAANGVEINIQSGLGYTPTPVVSHAIIQWNSEHCHSIADGIVITPSHNPPEDGGIKYDPPHGGPASPEVTGKIQTLANEIIKNGCRDVKRIPFERALTSSTTHQIDYVVPYVDALTEIINLKALASSGIKIGADPLGGSGIAFWEPIADKYGIKIHVINKRVDPTFSFMTLDHDGKIRMDCSSPYAMAGLLAHKDEYDIAFGNDTDYDRHGIVTPRGLMDPNAYLAVATRYLFFTRKSWPTSAAVGKTLVSSSLIDRTAESIGRKVYEVPVGFKWFVDGLSDGSLGFGGEESAGASFLRTNGSVWTTDKDGFIMDLLAAEMLATTEHSPDEHYDVLTQKFGTPFYERIDAAATKEQKAKLKKLSRDDIKASTLAGEKIEAMLTEAPGNGAPIDGLKVVTQNGWFAARPSGTEDVYKIYAESFKSEEHLRKIQEEARDIVNAAIA